MPLEPQDKEKYRPLYVQTARAYLNDMQRSVTILLGTPDSNDAFDVVHLASHSLTSQSTMMEYNSMAGFASSIEKPCKAKKEGTYSFTPEVWTIIDAGIKRAQESVNEIEKSGNELDLTPETQRILSATNIK